MFRIFLFIFALTSPLIAPLGTSICGGTLANLKMLDTGHPVDPCVDVMATLETAVSTITSYITTVDLPPSSSTFLSKNPHISLLFTCLHSPEILSIAPQTPPHRFTS